MKNKPRCLAYRLFQSLFILQVVISLSGCAYLFYARTPPGKFSGKLYVEWIAPNEFIYRPDDVDPLVFLTADGRKIQPQLMYTNGGSIPRLFWSAQGYGPWDFAPGFIIHDWLFEQHHCKGGDWDKYDLNDAATVLAEAMKSQMEKSGQPEPVVLYAVNKAVRSPIAMRKWQDGVCSPPPSIAVQSAPSKDAPNGISRPPVRLLTIEIR